ncbi:VapE domain-containing protein [Fluviispira multicolorata]
MIAKVLMHFIWQIKRKIANLKVQNHLCPVLINTEQGVGKSEFVRNFCYPFSKYPQFYAEKKVSEVADTREIASNLERNIIFMDELASSEKSDISYLKSIITSEMLSPRILGTNRIISVKNNVTFIATANIDNLSEKIKDETGNRRFFPIEIKSFKNVHVPIPMISDMGHLTEEQKKQGMLYPLEFDGSCFWALVDENWDCFLSLEELAPIQRKHTSTSDIDGFIDMFSIIIDNNKKAVLVSDLFFVFKKVYPKSRFDHIKKFSQEMSKRFSEAKTNTAGFRRKDIGFHLSLTETFNEYLSRYI